LPLRLRRLPIGRLEDVIDSRQHRVFIDLRVVVNGFAMELFAKGE
jgi:hypothetical protein